MIDPMMGGFFGLLRGHAARKFIENFLVRCHYRYTPTVTIAPLILSNYL